MLFRTRGRAKKDHAAVSLVVMRKRRGSGDSPGLQNRRTAVNPSLVGSTPTRFRQKHGESQARTSSVEITAIVCS